MQSHHMDAGHLGGRRIGTRLHTHCLRGHLHGEAIDLFILVEAIVVDREKRV